MQRSSPLGYLLFVIVSCKVQTSCVISYLLSGNAYAHRPLHKIHVFFFILSVSCWNIQFGAICHFQPTNSASSRENLRIVFTYFANFVSSRRFSRFHLAGFRKRSPSIPVISLSASLSSARELIKYSKPNAVRTRRNVS